MIVDNENAQTAGRIILRDQRLQTSPDIFFLVARRNDDRDQRRLIRLLRSIDRFVDSTGCGASWRRFTARWVGLRSIRS
jgi:hypothetical protein